MRKERVPLDEKAELVRNISIILARKNGRHASVYWHGMAKRLLRLSIALGVSREAAEAEVHRLLAKVLSEITRRELAPQ